MLNCRQDGFDEDRWLNWLGDVGDGAPKFFAMSGIPLDEYFRRIYFHCMGRLLERVTAGSPAYAVERTADGYILVGEAAYREEFSELVRDLLNHQSDELVVLPISDGQAGYESAIILPM